MRWLFEFWTCEILFGRWSMIVDVFSGLAFGLVVPESNGVWVMCASSEAVCLRSGGMGFRLLRWVV